MLEKMPEKKLKRIIVGVTIAGTLLLTVLFAVIIYQWISMGVKSYQINKAQEEIKQFQEQKDLLQGNLDYFEQDGYKEKIARKYGYVYPEDQTSGENG